MITIVVCIKRKPSMTQEQFTAYWRDVHAPKLLACGNFTRHITSYVQYHLASLDASIASLFGDSGDFDGVAALTFASEEAMRSAFAEPDYLVEVRPDEFNFVDTTACKTILTSPFVAKAG